MPTGRPLEPAEAVRVMREAGWEPQEPFSRARDPWLCRCTTCGKESKPRLCGARTGKRCQNCCRTAPVDPEFARRLMLGLDLEPLEAYPGKNNRPWRCLCLRCGSEVAPPFAYAQQRGSRGCSTCKSTTCRDLRLSETDPVQAVEEMRAFGYEPLEPFHGTNAHWACRCIRCGAPGRPRLNTLRQRGGRCGDCAPRRGFKPNRAALVYLIYHEAHHAIKVGVSNVGAGRLDAHQGFGWVALAVEYVSGELAMAIEKAILDWWRTDLRLPSYLSRYEMPQNGWTETVEADAINIPATIARVRALAAA